MTAVVLALDTSNIVARAYHSVKQGGDSAPIGLVRHRLKSMVQSLIKDADPIRRITAVDAGRCWREDEYPDYKGGRAEKDQTWRQLMSEAPGILADEFGFEAYTSPGFEADDTLATIADQLLPYKTRTLLVSNDRDLLGVVSKTGRVSGTYVLRHESGAYRAYGPDEVYECKKVGVPPLRVAMFKALAGDDSDNLPGVYGFGPVTARRLAKKYGTPSALFRNLGSLTKTEREKLETAGEPHVNLMYRLSTLNCKAPIKRF